MTYAPQYPQPAFSRCNGGYNSQAQTTANPLGFDNGGYLLLYPQSLQDVATLTAYVAGLVQIASTYASGDNGWTSVASATLARVSETQFTDAGDWRGTFQVGRALQVTQTQSGFGFVQNAAFDGTATTVTVTDIVLDSGFSALAVGQAVENAPRSASSPLMAQIFG